MADYSVEINALNGALLATLDEGLAEGLQFSFNLNGPGAIDFTVPLRHPQVTKTNFAAGKREIRIKRDGALVWGGYMWMLTATTEDGRLRVGGEGWYSRLRRRYIDSKKVYASEEQFDIAWDLIDFTQGKTNGALGITRWPSETPSGVTRDRTYHDFERVFVAEAIEGLVELDTGFDFEIDPSKVWKAYYPQKGTDKSGTLTFELGDNIGNIAHEEDASRTATEITALGSGERDNICIAVSSDATAMAGFGRLEDVISYPDIKHASTLQSRANEELSIRKGARDQPQLSVVTNAPDWTTDYSVGDSARVLANYGWLTVDAAYRIISIVVHVAKAGNEVISVHFDGVTV